MKKSVATGILGPARYHYADDDFFEFEDDSADNDTVSSEGLFEFDDLDDDLDFEDEPLDSDELLFDDGASEEADAQLFKSLIGVSDVDNDEVIDQENASFELPNTDSGLPGAQNYVEDEPEPEPEAPKDWVHDRDPAAFMEYIQTSYPGGIPPHDGKTVLGCERAILYLSKLNKEISEALRADSDNILDIATLENIRIKILKDIQVLKAHSKKLNEMLKNSSSSEDILIKEASTPKIQLVMTPFERAITGMIINSVVSAGKPLEDVYDFLKKKYKFTPREELSIIQLLMDMGQPIFKDRGTIGEVLDVKNEGQGVDFMTNYFA